MPLALFIIITVILLVNTGVLGFVWWQMRDLDQRMRQLNATVQRQDREITQQRYGLAMLRWDPLESTCRHASLSIL